MAIQRMSVAAICVAGLLVGVPARGQSLGDLAKRTQEQRDKAKSDAGAKKADEADKDTKTGKKVYTDQDLKTLPPIAGGTASASESAATTGATSAADGTKDTSGQPSKTAGHGEAYWRARWMPLADRIAKGEEQAAATRKRIDEMTFQLRSLGKLAAQRDDQLVERQRLIAQEKQLTEQVASDKAALTAVQEEGRQAGALPGWFR